MTGQGGALWVANKGTIHELTIFPENGGYYVDNVRDRILGKCWDEFPRRSKSVKGCKISATRIMGERINWVKVEEGSE